jgi:hypothetical protein
MQYHQNRPYLIGFPGNYQEMLTTESGLSYNIFHLPNHLYGTPLYGTANIITGNVFENLPYTDTTMLAHWAQDDIAMLYALGILDMPVAMFNPTHLITRAEFVTMLAKALKLPIEPLPSSTARRNAEVNIIFPDVRVDNPAYPYILAAFNAGLVSGRGGGMFEPDAFLTLEESVQMIIGSLGLLRLGIPTNMTPFTDDDEISDWARQALYAARRIGLFSVNLDGTINPRLNINKAFAASVINRIIDYMRVELRADYTDNIVHFAR